MLKKFSSKLFTHLNTDSLRNRFIKGVAGSFGLKIFSTALNFIRSLMFARLLGTEGLGIYTYAITWVGLFRVPATLGLPTLIVREVAIYQAQSSWGLSKGLLRWSNYIVLLVSIVLSLIAGGIFWSLNIGKDFQTLLTISIALLSLPINSLVSLKSATIKGLHKVVLAQVPVLIIAPLLLIILTGFGYLFLKENLNASWVMGINFAATCIAFIISTWLLGRELPKVVKDAAPEYQTQKWIRSCLPLIFLGFTGTINSQTDILMLGTLKGAESVGIYMVINRITSLVVFILMTVNSLLAPTTASLYAEGKMKQLQRVITKSSRLVFLVSFIAAIILIGFSDSFLLLFGRDFVQGKNPMVVLIIAQLFNASVGPVNLLLTMTNNEKYTAMSVAIGAVLNVVLNALLIPQWGLTGAAVATATSMILWNFISLILVNKKLGIDSTALGIFTSY